MANSGANEEVEDGWRYCSVCRRNHEEGRKHIFTKGHVSKLKTLMGKFMKKVRAARHCLSRPVVLAGELEPGAKVWCYPCQLEVPKHVTDGNTSVEWGGFIEHMSRPDHHKKTRRYWWEVGAESHHLATVILFPTEYNRYKVGVASATETLGLEEDKRMEELADELRMVEQQQVDTALEPPISFQKPNSKTGKQTNTASQVAHCSKSGPQSGRGNIHTGATPPWLRDEGDVGGASTIGPSEEEFIKHRERLRHSGKNPRRVGADFHLQLALARHRGVKEDDSWLPTFGRVWNEGPRSHTRSEYRGEVVASNKKQKMAPTSIRTSTVPPQSTPHTSSRSTSCTPSQSTPHSHTPPQSTPHSHTPPQSTPHSHTPSHSTNTDCRDGLVVKPYTRKRKINKTTTSEC